MKTRGLQRIFKRTLEEIRALYQIACFSNIKDAYYVLDGKLVNRKVNSSGKKETVNQTKRLMRKHNVIFEYIAHQFAGFSAEYKCQEDSIPSDSNFKNCIWVCWWQGIDNAPTIVKECIKSIQTSAGGKQVILLDENNYKNYVKIPEFIEEKKNKGIISRTHYSDYLRVELLAEHGGIWLDSTFFCKNVDFDSIFKLPVWSIKRPDYGHLSIACGSFANYSLGCNFANRKFFAIIRDYLSEYWKKYDYMIDYLFLDYLIVLAKDTNEYINHTLNSIPENNPECDELQKIMNFEFNADSWRRIWAETQLFKLSWKQSYALEVEGKDTYYKKLIDKEL